MIAGRFAIARATATRCCSPTGELRWKVIEPPAKSHKFERFGSGKGVVGDLVHQFDILPRGQARNEIVELKNEPDALATILRKCVVVHGREVLISEPHLARCRTVEAPHYV
jgi:hypothetical protein